jgi:hypothetical protein
MDRRREGDISQASQRRKVSLTANGKIRNGKWAQSIAAIAAAAALPPIVQEADVIQIRRTGDGDPLAFDVVVREGKSETRHQVTMSRAICERLTAGKHTPEACVEAAFRFLLDREPNDSILASFDIMVISRYFPEFERELPRYLARS